jgi:hypothetical protein
MADIPAMPKRVLCVILFAASLLVAQPGAVVTEKMSIRIDGRIQTARKINGRWWSLDNRELTRTNSTWLWVISEGNARELVRFDHHSPVDPGRVALLNRSMGPSQVRGILGPPNSVFPSDRPEQQQHWDYYGPDGYKLSIQFASSGEGIFTASFEPDVRTMPKDVPHLAFRFNGKTTQESFAELKQKPAARPIPSSTAEYRAQLLAEMAARRGKSGASATPAPSILPVPSTTSAPATLVPHAPISRKVTAAEMQSISIGMPRAKLIELLGEPFVRASIASGDGTRETLRYQTDSGRMATIVLVGAKVSELPR